jgi:predicted dehydrogenase
MASGQTASFTMVAFTEAVCSRQTRIHGTKGELTGDMETFSVFDFSTRKTTKYTPASPDVDAGSHGHGGGDIGLVSTFVKAVASRDQSLLGVTPQEVLQSHLMVFAAETARREGKVLSYPEYVEQLGK